MARKDNKLSQAINDAMIEASKKIAEEVNQKGVDFVRGYVERAHKQERARAAKITRIARLESTLDTVLFHLRRGDHVDPLCGRRCTNQMIDAITKALSESPPNARL